MPLSLDLHSHTKPSKTMRFSAADYERTIAQAMKVGLDGYAATEHFHAPDYWRIMADLATRFAYHNGVIRVREGFSILTGAEIDVAEGGHILAIGPLDALAWLDHQFETPLSKGYQPPAEQLIATARHVDLVLIGAHPTRASKYLAGTGLQTLGKLDALEINGKDVAESGDVAWVASAAQELGLITVGSSDAHVWGQIGAQRTVIDAQSCSVQGLRDALKGHAERHIVTSPAIRALVQVSKRHKTIAKRHAKAAGIRIQPGSGATWPVAMPAVA